MTEAFFLKAVGLFLIGLVRFSGFFLNLPIFGESVVPMRAKAGLSALCAMLILPHLIATQEMPELTVLGYGLMALRELVLGLSVGFLLMMNIEALKLGGQLIGMQVGFSFVQVVDPESNRSQAIISEFLQLVALIVFLVVNGHLIFLQAFATSFDLVPLAGINMPGGVVAEMVRISASIFWIGMQVSMPVFAVILAGDVALGIIARTVPRMNIFQVGFALKVLMGMGTLILCLPYVGDLVRSLLHGVYGDLNTLLNKMG